MCAKKGSARLGRHAHYGPELAPGHRVSRPRGTGSVGDSVGEGTRGVLKIDADLLQRLASESASCHCALAYQNTHLPVGCMFDHVAEWSERRQSAHAHDQ